MEIEGMSIWKYSAGVHVQFGHVQFGDRPKLHRAGLGQVIYFDRGC